MQNGKAFDYVIVGAGSAGCTLAYRLGEDKDVRILVLEAGGWDKDPWIHMPLGWGKLLEERRHDWMYFTEPEPQMANRRIECARGKVVGGSSSINAMAYVRGHRGDYDRWRQMGLTGWSYADVLPYFKRSEAWEDGENPFRGGAGPLSTRKTRFNDAAVDAWIEAGKDAGYGYTEDYNGAQQDGFCRIQQTIRNGKRCSAAVAYLMPALARGNVTLETEALALRVVLEGGRAVGVEYERNGKVQIARAEREVLLSGGVINSPQLLMLSGIGAPEDLRPHGIEVKVPLNGVGKNLQDHVSGILEYSRKDTGTFKRNMRLDRLALSLPAARLFGTGFAADLPSGFMAFVKTRPELEMPDVQFLFRALPVHGKPYWPVFGGWDDGFGIRPAVLRPESRGSVRLASADPKAPIRIQQNFLASDNDVRTLRTGFKMLREVAEQPALKRIIAKELAPGPDVKSDTDIDAFLRKTSATVHHPLGTCKMGIDESAVVDPELKVRGVEKLRVVDASVMPDLVGGNINAPVIMIAEKGSDMIRGKKPLPSAAT